MQSAGSVEAAINATRAHGQTVRGAGTAARFRTVLRHHSTRDTLSSKKLALNVKKLPLSYQHFQDSLLPGIYLPDNLHVSTTTQSLGKLNRATVCVASMLRANHCSSGTSV